MPLCPSQFVPYEAKTSVIKITSYDNKNLCGTVSNTSFAEEKTFRSSIELILIIDELLNTLNFPRESMQLRRFSDVTPAQFLNSEADGRPVIATFKINVLFRQHASWQGNLIWVDQASEAQFRSVLELLTLIDSVLNTETASKNS